jgi:hypothetical protein
MKKNILLIIIIIFGIFSCLFILGILSSVVLVSLNSAREKALEVQDKSFDLKLPINATTFFDGKEGYSISIPTGNYSVCTWNYSCGSGVIPYIKTTEALTAIAKHTIYRYPGSCYDWEAICIDNFGNHYKINFPE